MLASNDKETDERLCKPLCLLTPVEYDQRYIEEWLSQSLKRLELWHQVRVVAISFVDGQVKIEWEEN
jgi:hypothetical protein